VLDSVIVGRDGVVCVISVVGNDTDEAVVDVTLEEEVVFAEMLMGLLNGVAVFVRDSKRLLLVAFRFTGPTLVVDEDEFATEVGNPELTVDE